MKIPDQISAEIYTVRFDRGTGFLDEVFHDREMTTAYCQMQC